MSSIAHSADSKNGVPEQTYKDHVVNVVKGSVVRARGLLLHRKGRRGYKRTLLRTVYAAAAFHDLGKLSPGFQQFLKTAGRDASGHVRHEDAGVVALLNNNQLEAAFLVSCHHRGLIDLGFEPCGDIRTSDFRLGEEISSTRTDTEERWTDYLQTHRAAVGGAMLTPIESFDIKAPLTRRLLLSCLVDADHTDTARHYRQHSECKSPQTLWRNRIDALDAYIADIESNVAVKGDEEVFARNSNRSSFYHECASAEAAGLMACEAPVGSGKTTAVMAHLLRVAAASNARHIIVVLPFTNIIRQSVQVYRNSLVLPGEKPEEVVAEHHHQVEFEDEGLRHLTTLWKSPIIVTTAVQFFETLAACKTSRLRKLHELPGSCVFVDEAHAAMPAEFLPVAWKWMTELQTKWNCHFVLASGSLAKFWELESFQKIIDLPTMPEIKNLGMANLPTLLEAERIRLDIRSEPTPVSYRGLIQMILNIAGPRIVVVNTVQSAALLAKYMADQGEHVLHLSTALAPCHRAIIIDRIKMLLKNESDWTLVATSLVEAGMDFSFRNGFRQRASTTSLIQLGGRVNRNAEWKDSQLWDVTLSDEHTHHPGLAGSAYALGELLSRGVFNSETRWPLEKICQEALNIEFSQKGRDLAGSIVEKERSEQFKSVAADFQIISGDTRTVIVDREIVRRVESFEKVEPIELIQNSIQLWNSRIKALDFPAIRGRSRDVEIYRLPDGHNYDPDFLGYMEGVIRNDSAKITGGYFI
jgi:CRISPR-associated endonuclease Cas3-HD